MIVVSDASVLIHLARIDRFDLLQRLYTEITVPSAVWQETVVEGDGRSGAPELKAARASSWVEVASIEDSGTRRLLRQALDAGEADALALADQMEADLVLLDESAARRRADRLGLRKNGDRGRSSPCEAPGPHRPGSSGTRRVARNCLLDRRRSLSTGSGERE